MLISVFRGMLYTASWSCDVARVCGVSVSSVFCIERHLKAVRWCHFMVKRSHGCIEVDVGVQAADGPMKVAFGITIVSQGGNDEAVWRIAHAFQQQS